MKRGRFKRERFIGKTGEVTSADDVPIGSHWSTVKNRTDGRVEHWQIKGILWSPVASGHARLLGTLTLSDARCFARDGKGSFYIKHYNGEVLPLPQNEVEAQCDALAHDPTYEDPTPVAISPGRGRFDA